jgi:uncharacterized protein YfaS (alpha-2-macroglobulin family)
MPIIKEYEAGDTARFKTVFRDDEGNIIEPDATNGDHDVDIEITDLSSGDVVENEEMDEISDTEFKYDWQTTEDLPLGEYEVEVRGSFQGDTALNRDKVQLVRTKTR